MSALHNADDIGRTCRDVALKILRVTSADDLVAPVDDTPLDTRISTVVKLRRDAASRYHYEEALVPVREKIQREKMEAVLAKQPTVVGMQTREQEITRMLAISAAYEEVRVAYNPADHPRLEEVVKPYVKQTMHEIDSILLTMIQREPPIKRKVFASCVRVLLHWDDPAATLPVLEALASMNIKSVASHKPFPEMKLTKVKGHTYGANDWVEENLRVYGWYDAGELLGLSLYPKIIKEYEGLECANRLRTLITKVPLLLSMKLGSKLPTCPLNNEHVGRMLNNQLPHWSELKHKTLCPGLWGDQMALKPEFRPDHPLISTPVRQARNVDSVIIHVGSRDPTFDLFDVVVMANRTEAFTMLCSLSPEMGAYAENACHCFLLDAVSFNSSKPAAAGGAIQFAEDPTKVNPNSWEEPKLRVITHAMQALLMGCCGFKGDVKIPSLTVGADDLAYYVDSSTNRWVVDPGSQAVQFREFERRCYVRNYLWQKVLWAVRVRWWAWVWFEHHVEQEGMAEFVDGNDGLAVLVGSNAVDSGAAFANFAVEEGLIPESEESKEQKRLDAQITKELKDPTLRRLYAETATMRQAVDAQLAARAKDRERREEEP